MEGKGASAVYVSVLFDGAGAFGWNNETTMACNGIPEGDCELVMATSSTPWAYAVATALPTSTTTAPVTTWTSASDRLMPVACAMALATSTSVDALTSQQAICDCDGNKLDALGICGGDCTDDADGDGICDDVDDVLASSMVAASATAQVPSTNVDALTSQKGTAIAMATSSTPWTCVVATVQLTTMPTASVTTWTSASVSSTHASPDALATLWCTDVPQRTPMTTASVTTWIRALGVQLIAAQTPTKTDFVMTTKPWVAPFREQRTTILRQPWTTAPLKRAADMNGDWQIQLTDLLDFLLLYGTDCEETVPAT